MTSPRTGSVSAQNEDELILSGRTTVGGGLGEKGGDGWENKEKQRRKKDGRQERKGKGSPRGCLLFDFLIWNSLTCLSTTRSEWRDSSTERRMFDFLREALFLFRAPELSTFLSARPRK